MAENKPNPGTAAVLSFVFTGLGQLYNGQIRKGLWIIFLSGLSMVLIVVGAILIWQALVNFLLLKVLILGSVLFCSGVIMICILGAYSIFDAYNYALKK